MEKENIEEIIDKFFKNKTENSDIKNFNSDLLSYLIRISAKDISTCIVSINSSESNDENKFFNSTIEEYFSVNKTISDFKQISIRLFNPTLFLDELYDYTKKYNIFNTKKIDGSKIDNYYVLKKDILVIVNNFLYDLIFQTIKINIENINFYNFIFAKYKEQNKKESSINLFRYNSLKYKVKLSNFLFIFLKKVNEMKNLNDKLLIND